jgi:phospholipid/cholesterol/gamma-HCH transport system substrate-binding protein
VKLAIRKHWRDFAAIVALFVVAAVVVTVILTNQRLTLPGWVPVIGKDFYEFNGEFTTAQAVTPGQGQSVNVAGVKVGEISRVDLRAGRAVIGMKLDDPDITVRRDATLLLRPKTGLKDMTVELDPGSDDAPRLAEDGTIPIGQTQPDVNLDELLSALDSDTRTYLQLLLATGGDGLRGRGRDLGDTIRTFEPTAAKLRAINDGLAARRRNIRRTVHNFSLVAAELGDKDDELARFVTDSNAVLRILADQEANIRATLRELPSALRETRVALADTRDFAAELGPALQALRPGARRLAPTLREVRPFLEESTPIVRDAVRPLVREARPLVDVLRPTLRDLDAAQPDLLASFRVLNTALDALAYNPAGPAEEGYLFWLSWLNHLSTSLFSTQDAHGPVRRGLIVANCEALSILDTLRQVNPVLGTTISVLNFPATNEVCGTGAAAGTASARTVEAP